MFAAIAFAVAGLLPSMHFLWAGFSDDPTATGSAGSAVAWLVGIVVVIGAVLGTIGWAEVTVTAPMFLMIWHVSGTLRESTPA